MSVSMADSNVIDIFREYMALESRRKQDALSVAELARWTKLKRVLNRHFQPGVDDLHEDRRDSVRVPVSLRVGFESYGQIGESLMTNLSRGGLFVDTDTPLPIGTPIRLRVRIEESDREIELTGEVVSTNMGAKTGRDVHGMGVRFSKMDDDQQKVVDDLYERALHKALTRPD
jgi:type IV pilus assembly protein PilZ